MVAWSSARQIGSLLSKTVSRVSSMNAAANTCRVMVPTRGMSAHRTFVIHPSKYGWVKFKDTVHFYVMVGLIPWVAVITYANIFIGPAQLAPIPEGYVPEHHEYYRHPVTRFFAKYICSDVHEDHERTLHEIYEEEQKTEMRFMTERVEEVMARTRDYKLFWHQPVTTKYHQHYKQEFEHIEDDYFGENVTSNP